MDSSFVALLVYMDEIIIVSNNDSLIIDVKSYLHELFKIKDLSALKYFLGSEVAKTQ